MPLTTTRVTGRISLPDDISPEKAHVAFTLLRYDTDAADDVTIIPDVVRAAIDAGGDIDVDLWPNARGERETYYSVSVVVQGETRPRTYAVGFAVVPEVGGPYDLNDLLAVEPPPGANVNDYIAQLSAAAASAQASAEAAGASAAVAESASGNPYIGTPGGPVRNATTANITLSGEQTIDGVLTSASRILVKDQTAPAENGIYVTAAGAWARATDMDAAGEFLRKSVYVTGGTVNAGRTFGCASTVVTVGTDAVSFTLLVDQNGLAAIVATKANQSDLAPIMTAVDHLSGGVDAVQFVDGLGNVSGKIDASGKLVFAAGEFDELTADEIPLVADAVGQIVVVEDILGNYSLVINEDGTIKTTNQGVSVAKAGGLNVPGAGKITFSGSAVTVSATADGAEVAVSGGDGGAATLGKTASNYTESVKISEPSLWGDRTLVLTAGASMDAGSSGSSSVLYPSVIRTDRIVGAIADYYMYYATDHDTGDGGIFLATASNPMGPWTPYGRVFLDTAGAQTETPSVIWDRHMGHFKMFYQQQGAKYGAGDSLSANGVQSTLCAHSTNGLSWTKDPNFVIDSSPEEYGDGHTGYFFVSETPDGYFARSVYGGTIQSQLVTWRCEGTLGGLNINGFITNNWRSDRRPIQYGCEFLERTAYADRLMQPITLMGYNVLGARYAVGLVHTQSAGTASLTSAICVGPISGDYKRFAAMPNIIWEADAAWETADVRGLGGFVDDEFVYIYYTFATTDSTRCDRMGVIRHAI